ncbi:trigger factor [Eggerthellaceae bacterium zg-1084]|uniref:trigger factor n=1 Tax=Berryella wangjianweii TaxID=2734634 RepID=UPI00155759A5|nr:trigger factor [Berryella wangjianweii]NPD31284.1 trigger factor [Berryella wangjianweii]
MNTSVEALEGNRVKITVTVDEAAVVAQFKQTYRQLAGQYSIPGFRKGKAPRGVINNVLGKDAVAAQVTDAVVNDSCGRAIDAAEVFPVGKPSFDDDMPLVVDGQAYTYSFELGVTPEVELSGYDAVSFALPAEGATDAEVDAEVDALTAHYVEFVDAAANAKVKEDGFVSMTVAATDAKGERMEALCAEGRQYGLGSGSWPADFDAELVGMKKGEQKQFELEFEGAPVSFDVTVNAVQKKKQLELTDEWVKSTFGLEDVADLRKNISEGITSQKAAVLPRMKEARALEALLERVTDEAPEAMVEGAEQQLVQDFFQQLQRQGLTFDAYLAAQDLTPQQFREDVKKQAADTVKQDLALDAWARHAGIAVTDEDVSAEFARSGAEDPAAVEKSWRDAGQIHLVRQGVLRQKALESVLEGAVITEEQPEGEAEKKPAKKASAKKAAKKKDADAEADAEKGADEAPAKKPAKKASAKKADAKDEGTEKAAKAKKKAADKPADESAE